MHADEPYSRLLPDPQSPRNMIPGRNDPCPCGSGRKYKKCHGALAIVPFAPDALAPAAERVNALQQLDHDLVKRMMSFSRSHYNKKWFDAATNAYRDFDGVETELLPVEQDELQFAMAWAFHSFAWGRRDESMAEHFRREMGRQLLSELRELLDAQLLAWCSFWRVDTVDPGVGLGLYDLLSQQKRYVHERMGSTQMRTGVVLLCRIVDVGDASFIAGMHPYSAPLLDVLPIVEHAKRRARVRTRPVPLDFLRLPRVQGWMIGEWRSLTSRLRRPPTLANTDGDPFVLTTDHLAFSPADRREVLTRLAGLEGANERETEGAETVFAITRAGNALHTAMESTLIGRISVTANRLRVETNSTRRGDALRAAVLARTTPLVKHLLRDESSFEQLREQSQRSAARGKPLPPRPKPTPDEIAIVREYKQRHYTAWLDDRIPALGDKTPRAAAKSAQSRARLEALLASMDASESRLPEEERFDVAWLREQLGL